MPIDFRFRMKKIHQVLAKLQFIFTLALQLLAHLHECTETVLIGLHM